LQLLKRIDYHSFAWKRGGAVTERPQDVSALTRAPFDLFRIVKGPTPTHDDFASQAAQFIDDLSASRRPMRGMPDDGETLHMWAGASVFGSAERAQAIMRRFPRIGTSIARLRVIPEALMDGTLRLEKTGADPEHYTLWGSPEDLLACVQSGQP
jgi:hypothetical protein